MNSLITKITTIAILSVGFFGFSFNEVEAAGQWANKQVNSSHICDMAMGGANKANGTKDGIVSDSSESCWTGTSMPLEAGDTYNILVKMKNIGSSPITNPKVTISGHQGSVPSNNQMIYTVTLEGTSNGSTVSTTATVPFSFGSSAVSVSTGDIDFYPAGPYGNGGSPTMQIPMGTILTSGKSFSSQQTSPIDFGEYGYVAISFGVNGVVDDGGGPVDPGNDPINIDLDVNGSNSENLNNPGNVVLDWTINSGNPTSCISTWDGSVSTNGGADTVFVSNDTTFSVTCTDGSSTDTSTVTVTVDGDNNNNGGSDNFEMITLSPTNIQQNSARLRGEVGGSNENNVDVWFVVSQAPNQDPECQSSSDLYVDVLTDYDSGEDFSKTVTNLLPDTTYYYRACGYNDNGDLEHGSVKRIKTRSNVQTGGPTPPNNNTTFVNTNFTFTPTTPSTPGTIDTVIVPKLVTMAPKSVQRDSAVVSGAYNANGCTNFRTYIEAGVSPSNLNIKSPIVTRGNTFGIHTTSFTNLRSATTYYYNIVGVCGTSVYRGEIRTFKTGGLPTPVRTTTRTTTTRVATTNTVSNLDGAGSCLDLDITNDQEGVVRGTNVLYQVSVANRICRETLDNVLLTIPLPDYVDFVDTSRGTYAQDEHTIVVNLGELERETDLEKAETMEFVVRIKNAVKEGDIAIMPAEVTYDRAPEKSDIQENAREVDVDPVLSAAALGLGASAFSAGNFFGSVWGWLILLLLIILGALTARYFYLAGIHEARKGGYGAHVYDPVNAAMMGRNPQPAYGYSAAPAAPAYAAQPVMNHVAPATMETEAPKVSAPAPQNIPADNYHPWNPGMRQA